MALAMLGGSVLAADLRLLNVVLRDVPSNVVTDNAHKWFKVALTVQLITGFFMLAGVATKCYHNPFYWVKMTALAIGVVFVFAIRRPLLQAGSLTASSGNTQTGGPCVHVCVVHRRGVRPLDWFLVNDAVERAPS